MNAGKIGPAVERAPHWPDSVAVCGPNVHYLILDEVQKMIMRL